MTNARSAHVAPAAPPVPPLVLRPLRPGPARAAALALLSAGGGMDDEEPGGLDRGMVFALTDLAGEPGGPPAAAALAVPADDGDVELRRFAVHPALPEAAVGPRLLAGLADALRAAGCRRLVAAVDGTDACSLGLLSDAGFRAATPADGNGHLVSLRLEL